MVPALRFDVDVARTSSSAGEPALALPLPDDPSLIAATTFAPALAIEGAGFFFGFAGLRSALEVHVGDGGGGRGSGCSKRGSRERARLLARRRRAGTATA